jgi:hypothetical protein
LRDRKIEIVDCDVVVSLRDGTRDRIARTSSKGPRES